MQQIPVTRSDRAWDLVSQGAGWSWRDAVYTWPSESRDIWALTGWVLCPARILACVQAGLKSWCTPERDTDSTCSGTTVSFQMLFPPYFLFLITTFPSTRWYWIISFCAECGNRRVSLRGELYLFTAEYIILINGFAAFQQQKAITEYVHHTEYGSSSILKCFLLSTLCFKISTFVKMSVNLLSSF